MKILAPEPPHEDPSPRAHRMKILAPDLLWTDGEFRSGLELAVAGDGTIARVSEASASGPDGSPERDRQRLESLALLPGMVNAHSHAFQRGLRGKAETFGSGSGTFWSWRDEMYRLAGTIDRSRFEKLTELAFSEMIRSGITTVGEFHYLHHEGEDFDYGLDEALVLAADRAGIRLKALDVCYLTGDVGQPLDLNQRRFGSASVEAFVDSAHALQSRLSPTGSLGLVAHSIRAVPPEALEKLHRAAREQSLVLHMHVEEQVREIEKSIAAYGATPMGVLLERLELGSEFTAVHCTHSDPEELERFFATGANVCVCPLTEANLADGTAPAGLSSASALCLGSDSNIRIDMNEEMRWLEYAQRLREERRGIFKTESGDVARRLFHIATEGGARALGLHTGRLESGYPADFFTIDLNDPALRETSPEDLLAAFVFGAGPSAIRNVAVAGEWLPS